MKETATPATSGQGMTAATTPPPDTSGQANTTSNETDMRWVNCVLFQYPPSHSSQVENHIFHSKAQIAAHSSDQVKAQPGPGSQPGNVNVKAQVPTRCKSTLKPKGKDKNSTRHATRYSTRRKAPASTPAPASKSVKK